VKFNIKAIFTNINEVFPTTMTRHSAWLYVGTARRNSEPQLDNVSGCQGNGYPVTEHLHANFIRLIKHSY